jgi:hypothetical protein
VNREHEARLFFLVIGAAVRASHRRDEGNVEVRPAEHHTSRRKHRQAHHPIHDAVRVEPDKPAGIDLDAPEEALLIDGRPIGQATRRIEAGELTARADPSRFDIVVVDVDDALAGIGEIEDRAVRTPARTIRTDDAAVELVAR